MRGHHAFLSSLTPFQRQIWPRCRARPRARGMELSTVPHGCTRTCWGDARLRGQRQGPWRSHPAPSVRCPSVRHRSQHNRGRSRQTSPAGGLARTASPGTWTASLALSLFPSLGTPSPAPASPGSKALQSRHHKREGIPTPAPAPSPRAALGVTRVFTNLFSFGKAAGVQLSARFSPSQQAGAFHALLGLSRK